MPSWGWVWTTSVIFMAINLVFGILTLFKNLLTGLLNIIIPGIILWYLFEPKVKTYFGKS